MPAGHRRALALTAALSLALPAGLAAAQEDTDPGRWDGTTVRSAPRQGGATVHGEISWRSSTDIVQLSAFRINLSVEVVEMTDEECPPAHFGPAADPQPVHETHSPATRAGSGHWTGSFSVPLTAACNGVYRVTGVIRTEPSVGVPYTQTIDVRAANHAGVPADLSADLDEDGTASLAWAPPAGGLPRDFAGYRVEREGASSPVTTGTSLTSASDEPGLEPGESATYRVMTLREGPDGTVVTSPPATAEVSIPAPPEPEPDGPAEGGDDGGSDESDTDDEAPAPAETAGGAPGVSRPNVGARSPSVPGPSRPTTPTTLDTGFSGELPFDREPGQRDPVLPDDGFASLIFDDRDGAGLLVPGATAAVLLVWAMHLRYLNRLARQPA